MKNIRVFLSENFPSLVVKFSIYLNRRVFVMFYFRFSQKKKKKNARMSNYLKSLCVKNRGFMNTVLIQYNVLKQNP